MLGAFARVRALPLVMGGVAVATSVVIFAVLHVAAESTDEARFDRLTEQISDGFHVRLASTAQALRTASVVAASPETMNRRTWMDVLEKSAIQEANGLVGMGYVARVDREDIDEHEAWVRSHGIPDYTAARAGEHDPLYLVSFIEPLERNREALGVDIADGTNRRSAADTAMRQASLAMSRRIRVIVGEDVTPGFLLFYPVYSRGATIETEAERERALKGWVYAAVRVDGLVAPLQSRMADEIVFSVYEGKSIAGGRLLWSASPNNSLATVPRFERTTRVNVFGQPWILVTQSEPGLWDASRHTVAWLALLSGLALGSLAVMVNLRLSGRREKSGAQGGTGRGRSRSRERTDQATRHRGSQHP